MGQRAQMPAFTPFGTLFEPIGYIGGKPVWPILGGAPEDGKAADAVDGTENAGQRASDDDPELEKDLDNAGQGADDEDPDGEGETVSKAKFDRILAQLSAADKKRAEFEKKVQEFEDKDKSELERAQSELEALRKRDSERDASLKEIRLRDAFRDASGEAEIFWHNTDIALSQLDKDLLEIDDDGKVTGGMAKAVKALAKESKFLVNPIGANGDSGDNGKKSGGSFNGKDGGKKPVTDKDKLLGKYPALRGRGGN